MRKKKHAPPFFRATSGVARFGKQFGCGHTRNFCRAEGPAKMLVGELPKPAGLLDTLSRSPGASACCLRPGAIAPGPYSHARLLCRADDQYSLLLPRPPAFAAGPPGILHKALSFVPPAHGGMLQRIMIGIATAMKPALLIADEPTTAIDAITQYEILNELLHIKENHNTAMIFISHDLNAISRVADRIVVLNHGAVVDRGDFRHILHHAQDPYTKLLVEKRADVMRRYTAVLNGKKEAAHA